MSKSMLLIETPTSCWDCPCIDGEYGECQLINKRVAILDGVLDCCPLKPYKDAIPIEWIEKWLDKTTGTRDGEDISQLPEQLKLAIGMINLMEMDWEKENGN